MPDMTYMDQYIKDGKSETVSLNNLYDSILVGSTDRPNHIFRAPIGDFFLEHHDDLSSFVQLYELPEMMFYKPKLVSLELYGTTELWLSLLRVNNMENVTEFHIPFIRIYNPSKLSEYISIFFKREGKVT